MKTNQDLPKEPSGELIIRTVPMPKDTNSNGDIFGGWVVSQMDLAGGIVAKKHSPSGRAVTVAIEAMSFINPVHIGEHVSCYVKVLKLGNTSIQTALEVWTHDIKTSNTIIVTKGIFTYVAINDHGKSIALKPR